ncbi:protein MAINTENANCE OF PSII UNDER HIGH LIGHT 1-like [Juglans microcarpa x Juglans regia]|uniref:protein MAINTENANCE OF PSII UNDER HIGH LIGHT 1-like n=1 Tax=Juglans microcarpa x Juglans regia TaxID=2249226 RepID=UPI001B7EBD2D|nr:protein MAINTENANCE OF PSII UNDER HIGH LIGHT 1-like [Juglans microcarpa x Juglans regia]
MATMTFQMVSEKGQKAENTACMINLEKSTELQPIYSDLASSEDSDCNVEECAPDKEVGKASMEWLAGEKTKVVGTFPPRKPRGWTGYVEKDTAGQTNIYSVEVGGFKLLLFSMFLNALLLQVGKNPPQMQTLEYSGPSLSYYINKFKPQEIIQGSAPSQTESPNPIFSPFREKCL